MKRTLFAVLILAMALPVLADDTYVGSTEDPEAFGLPMMSQSYLHEELGLEFKGWAYFTVVNNGTEDWTDFHFQIIDAMGYDASGVTIDEALYQTSQAATVIVGETLDGYASIDFYFPGDVVGPGEMATFNFYTTNVDQVSYFGVAAWPTPEPATMAVLAIGGAGLLARRRRN